MQLTRSSLTQIIMMFTTKTPSPQLSRNNTINL